MTEQRKKKYFNPGEKADISGQYINIKTKGEVTVTKGKPFPPPTLTLNLPKTLIYQQIKK